MTFESEDHLRRAYREASPVDFEAEVPVGRALIDERAPRGLEGALAPQADLLGEAQESASDSHVLVETKQDFEMRGIGQLLFYEQLLRDDLRQDSGVDARIDRRIALGSRPPSTIPRVCSDLAITLEMPVQEKWQDITRSVIDRTDGTQYDDTATKQWLRETQSTQLRHDDEEEVLNAFLDTQLRDLEEETVYREITVGNQRFSDVDSRYRADAIGNAPGTKHFYVIEVKNEPDTQDLFKALGQAVTYASLFRQDWGLDPQQVIPMVLIDAGPWATNLYWETMYNPESDSTSEMMMKKAANRMDSVVLLIKQIARFDDL